MRFFAHDGKSTHGPAGIEDLLKLPGFDGDTLVCPVGSDDPSDWKAALAYPPFKKALLDAASAPAPAPVEPPKALPPMPTLLPSPKAEALPVPAPFPLPLPAAPAALAAFAAPPAPLPAPAPLPTLAPPPVPEAKTSPCPRCAHANLEGARYCNSCGARMDGRLEDLSAPAAAASLASAFSAPAPLPADDPFGRHDPLAFQPEPAPFAAPEHARRPLQPGKMGQLADLEEIAPAEPAPALAPSPAPDPAPTAWNVPLWKRPAFAAAFAAVIVAAGLGYMMLGKPPRVELAAEPAAELTPMPEPAPPAPVEAPKAPLLSTPPARSSLPASRSPAAAAKAAKTAKAPRKPRRPRRVAVAPPPLEGAGDTFIESRAPETKPKPKGKRAAKAQAAQVNADGTDPLLEALLTDATQSPAEPAAAAALEEPGEAAAPMIGQRPAAKTAQFALPGLQRPVSASDRAQRAAPPTEDAPPLAQPEGSDAFPLAEPGKSLPTPGIEDEPVKSAEGDQLALVQVHEQFDFCGQLIAQAAYGDHYDTCLCKDAREAAPYRGRRGFYATAKKKEASAGRLETSAKILSSKIDGGVASVTARWKSAVDTKGRTGTQSWKLEDGLWCQAP